MPSFWAASICKRPPEAASVVPAILQRSFPRRRESSFSSEADIGKGSWTPAFAGVTEAFVTEMTGGCMCGKVRFTARIADDDAYLCHCRMCQRSSGNVSLAMKNVRKADVAWEREPDHYQSSPIARRGFCSSCGTSLTFEYLEGSDKMDLIVGSFDDPSSFRPTAHFGAESIHRAWLNTEGLPEQRADEYDLLVDRWMKTVGKLPD